MATILTPTRPPAPRHDAGAPRRTDVIRAEWTKLRTVRSRWSALLIVLVGTVGIGALVCAAIAARWPHMSAPDKASFDPTFRSLTGLMLAQLAVGVLGCLAISAEYSSGMVRTTLAAVPRRARVLTAKVVALAPVALVVGTVACVCAFLAGQAALAGTGVGVALGNVSALRAVLGGGLYLTSLALLGLGLGTICRRSAAAISSFVGVVLVAPTVIRTLPAWWGTDIAKFLPSEAGQALVTVRPSPGQLAPWAGFAVLCLWTAAALAVGAWLLARRDA
jgi:ABC-type transport system involved in multi-copper enzyme maturation permease subunit